MRHATRTTWKDSGRPARAWHFGTQNQPSGTGKLVTFTKAGTKIEMRDAETGELWDRRGATVKMWLADDITPTAEEIAAATITARHIEAKNDGWWRWVTSGRDSQASVVSLYYHLRVQECHEAQAGNRAVADAIAVRIAEIKPFADACIEAERYRVPALPNPVALDETERAAASQLIDQLRDEAARRVKLENCRTNQIRAVDTETGNTLGTATVHSWNNTVWAVNVHGQGADKPNRCEAEAELRRLAVDRVAQLLHAARSDARAARALLAQPREHFAPAPADRIADRTAVAAAERAPAPVVVVPCGGRKAPGRLPAGEKYVGSYHQAARRAAAAIAERTGARVLILSALHGLLQLDAEIGDYDLTMGRPGSVTAARVAEQADQLGITDAVVTVVAGKRYADVATAVWPHAVRILDGTPGIGAQLARMKAIVKGTWTAPGPAGVTAVPALFGADLVAPAPLQPSAPALEEVAGGEIRLAWPADAVAPGSRSDRRGPRVRRSGTRRSGPVRCGQPHPLPIKMPPLSRLFK